MKEEVLQTIKEDYEKTKERRTNILDISKQLATLEGFDMIKEYLKLREELECVGDKKITEQTESQILNSSFRSHRYLIKETNEIYVCMGTFMLSNTYDIEHGPTDYRLKRDDPHAEYRIYKDIENDENIRIPINMCEEFESTHKVIIPKTSLTEKYFYLIQKEFIEIAINEGQAVACRKILSKKHK